MKKYIIVLVIVGLFASMFIYTKSITKKYVEATDILLEEIEELMDYNEISFGDTIAEGDAWCNYIELRDRMPY